jgi:hypothetical protein
VLDNAWKQQLYDQIDALSASGAVYGNWTPIDGSGAAIPLTILGARYCKMDKLVSVWADIVYPSTASSLQATISGLPFGNAGPNCAGCFLTFGPPMLFFQGVGVTYLLMFTPAMANQPNSAVSGARVVFQGSFLTT